MILYMMSRKVHFLENAGARALIWTRSLGITLSSPVMGSASPRSASGEIRTSHVYLGPSSCFIDTASRECIASLVK